MKEDPKVYNEYEKRLALANFADIGITVSEKKQPFKIDSVHRMEVAQHTGLFKIIRKAIHTTLHCKETDIHGLTILVSFDKINNEVQK